MGFRGVVPSFALLINIRILVTMYVRKKKRPQHTDDHMCIAVQIVETKRDGDRVKQRVVQHIGVARDDADLDRLVRLGESLRNVIEADERVSLYRPEDLPVAAGDHEDDTVVAAEDPFAFDWRRVEHIENVATGVMDVYGPMYHALGFDTTLPRSRFPAAHGILYETVMARLGKPLSKRASVAYLAAQFGSTTSLDAIYRMMDRLDEPRIEQVRERIAQATQDLHPAPVSVLFFDCTTLYFEAVHSDGDDDIRQFGYSKDGKSNRVQVVLALVVDDHGLPVAYELFPGSLYEAKTLEPVLAQLKAKFGGVQRVIVADAGMTNETNRNALKAHEACFILGARLKNLAEAQKAAIVDHDWSATPMRDWDLAEGRRLIVWHSPKRAERDRKLREKRIEQLKQRLKASKSPKQWLAKQGAKARFLTLEGKAQVALNEEAIAEAARWDGLSGVETNLTLPMDEVQTQYHGLWQVERSFRIQKHTLEIRPIFHWTEKRIRAHIAICYMAFACLRHVEYRLRIKGVKLSPERIRDAVEGLHDMVFCDRSDGRRFAIAAHPTADGAAVATAMQIQRKRTPRLLD